MAIDQATRILIVLQAGTESHEGRARALHGVLYATELSEAGATVRLVFDGAGTGWLARWSTEAGATSRAGRLFAELRARGLSYEVCDYCAGAFDVKEDLVEAGEALAGEYMDHPSLAAHVAEGFAVWIL
jgi:intracellular sulfur oxidation DsrE/DsrF family protein